MKTKLTSILSIIFISLFFSSKLMAWGNDVIVTYDAPQAQHSLAAKQNGTLYAAVPTTLLILEYGTQFFVSNDQGATWNPHVIIAPSSLNPVIRTKMVVTSLDSIICIIQQNNTLYFINVESGVTGQFTTSGVQDFDVAAGTGNFIYAFIQEPGLNTIKRYGTGDGGITWTGNTATVTTQGSTPRISMSGTRLILNYYGPVLPDTVSSVIRAAFYTEAAAGSLAVGTFQDVLVNTGVKRKQFQTVVNNGIVWLIYTEGDAQQVIKCRVSTDNGATYQPEFIISGDLNVNSYWFGAAPVTYSGTFGVTLTWLNDSIGSPPQVDQMIFATATNSNPVTFNIPSPPLNTYNDFTVNPSTTNSVPVLVNYNMGLNVETGVCWHEATNFPSLYYDRLSATTNVNETESLDDIFLVYPSPTQNLLYISKNTSNVLLTKAEIFTVDGKLLITIPVSAEENQYVKSQEIDVSHLVAGSYFIKIHSMNEFSCRKFVVIK